MDWQPLICGPNSLSERPLTSEKNLELMPRIHTFETERKNKPQYMELQTKEQYTSPRCEELEIKPMGIIAASGDAPDMTPGWEWNF